MNTLSKILFFADGASGQKSALASAVDFARHAEATLLIMAVVPKVSTDDVRLTGSINAIQKTIIEERKSELEELIKEIPGASGSKIKIVPGDKAFIEVIRAVVSEGYDLLAKAIDKPRGVKGAVFGSSDTRLLRQCPCPVWLIKNTRKKTRNILAALDVTSDDKKTRHLSEKILGLASSITQLEGAKLHALSTWVEPVIPALKLHIDASELGEIKQKHKESILKRFAALLKGESVAGSSIEEHVIHGEADKKIVRFVDDYDIDLLVMGTLSRSGIPGLLIGNTAERVLETVDCSVLTLKPPGFRTVIK